MWLPEVWSEKGAKKSECVRVCVERMVRMPHRAWVDGRRSVDEPLVLGALQVEVYQSRWEEHGWFCAGTRHGQPIGPYAWITLSLGLGIAYLEDLVDGDMSIPQDVFPSRWQNDALCAFAGVLFRKVDALRVFVLPMVLPSFFWEGLSQHEREDGKAWIVREKSCVR